VAWCEKAGLSKSVCRRAVLLGAPLLFGCFNLHGAESTNASVAAVVERVANHSFHPLRDGFTFDRALDKHGIASLTDKDWKVRSLAVRDLLRAGPTAGPDLLAQLNHTNLHVRQVCVMTLGLLRYVAAVNALQTVLDGDAESVVRSQAAISLGEIDSKSPLSLLQAKSKSDPSRDVRHQCELAAYRIAHDIPPDSELAHGHLAVDESQFGTVRVGRPSVDFALKDTEGKAWKLADFKGRKCVVLIWIFADWCPVCHSEFRELIETKAEFQKNDVQVITIESHDRYRCRVMVGQELEPEYWFSKSSFNEEYAGKIWWPHCSDPGGAVGAIYGVDPQAFAVHSEYVNRPSTFIIDKEGIVRFAYYGTFWGDRPSIRKALEMIQTRQFEYENPKRLKLP
jgi:peroxiredoxin